MIKLVVEDYCHNCTRFEADVDKDEMYSNDFAVCNTYISCKNHELCAAIKRYLEITGKEKEDKQNEDSRYIVSWDSLPQR